MPRFTELSPLFHLLDDYETHRSRRHTRTSCTSSTSFTPAFDVRELNDNYYLDGELPGVHQSNIEIEFSDPQTLVIKGHTERESHNDDVNPSSPSPSGGSPTRWHQPTVEDEEHAESETTDKTENAQSVITKKSAQHPVPQKMSSPRYWVSERSVGDFQRTFTFPARVDQDAVRASLKNGILSVVVPKEAAPRTKKIRVL